MAREDMMTFLFFKDFFPFYEVTLREKGSSGFDLKRFSKFVSKKKNRIGDGDLDWKTYGQISF